MPIPIPVPVFYVKKKIFERKFVSSANICKIFFKIYKIPVLPDLDSSWAKIHDPD